ncbi:helix-turn-helix transcriptional regulator [Sphaerisporangium perillae]|uniref:helix-turn-helix transcriptional regulator n=1 Tax=Sphaerisporangium perillae TaxID=2935860 RepID=UPI00200DD910|nr:WYL domain-containing protein [Sphaerisporangium perillae]
MNRTDRLYALIEELRAISPGCRSAWELSERLQVGVRTVERDIAALQQAGVPVRAADGGQEGYTLDETGSPSRLDLTPDEAVAVAVALSRAGRRPLAGGARSALRKLVATMPVLDRPPAGAPSGPESARGDGGAPGPESARGEGGAAGKAVDPGEVEEGPGARAAVARVIEEALLHRRVLRIVYEARSGAMTEREVEPGVFIGGRGGFWYLVGWCRLREDVRVFRLDRIVSAALTDERAEARRRLDEYAPHIPDLIARDQAT